MGAARPSVSPDAGMRHAVRRAQRLRARPFLLRDLVLAVLHSVTIGTDEVGNDRMEIYVAALVEWSWIEVWWVAVTAPVGVHCEQSRSNLERHFASVRWEAKHRDAIELVGVCGHQQW